MAKYLHDSICARCVCARTICPTLQDEDCPDFCNAPDMTKEKKRQIEELEELMILNTFRYLDHGVYHDRSQLRGIAELSSGLPAYRAQVAFDRCNRYKLIHSSLEGYCTKKYHWYLTERGVALRDAKNAAAESELSKLVMIDVEAT